MRKPDNMTEEQYADVRRRHYEAEDEAVRSEIPFSKVEMFGLSRQEYIYPVALSAMAGYLYGQLDTGSPIKLISGRHL